MPNVGLHEVPSSETEPALEVADIFRAYGPEYRRCHRLPAHQRRAMWCIEHCRTATLGGHADACDHCGTVRIAYNSCRNRHCPKCQGQARERWVAKCRAQLLPVEYFHVVFTLPETLHPLWRAAPRLVLNGLFHAAAQTLLEFGKRRLQGEVGITAVLHTWGQTLVEHPHLHCLVTGGALAADGTTFRRCPRGYLFPVRALAQVYRGKFCAYLGQGPQREILVAALPELASPERFHAYLRELRRQAWVVYAKRPCAGPEQVLTYLGRYTHRVAITNRRLLGMEAGQVRFTWKDYREGGTQKVLTLAAPEFIRRFLLHVLPPQFVRIRYYGLLANGRTGKLARCRELLQEPSTEPGADPTPVREPGRCSTCGCGRLVRVLELPPARGVRRAAQPRQRLEPPPRSKLHSSGARPRGFVQQGVAADTATGAASLPQPSPVPATSTP